MRNKEFAMKSIKKPGKAIRTIDIIILACVLAFILIFFLSRPKPSFTVTNTNGEIIASARNAPFGSRESGYLTLWGGEEIEIHSELQGEGEVFIDIEPLEFAEDADCSYSGRISGSDTKYINLIPNEYTITIIPEERTTGKVTIKSAAVDRNS